MSKTDLYFEIAMNLFGAVVMAFMMIVIWAGIIMIDGSIAAAIMVDGVFAILAGYLVVNEIKHAVRIYKLSKEEEL